MPQKRNHDFLEKYPNIKAGTYEPMHIKDILIKNRWNDENWIALKKYFPNLSSTFS